jgi:hypothetical protein
MLQSLGLEGVWLGDDNFKRFTQGCQQLRHLWLVGCGRLTLLGVSAALAELPTQQLTSFSISGCDFEENVNVGFMQQLAKQHGKSLRILSMLELPVHKGIPPNLHEFEALLRIEMDGEFVGDSYGSRLEACSPAANNMLVRSILEHPSVQHARFECVNLEWTQLLAATVDSGHSSGWTRVNSLAVRSMTGDRPWHDPAAGFAKGWEMPVVVVATGTNGADEEVSGVRISGMVVENDRMVPGAVLAEGEVIHAPAALSKEKLRKACQAVGRCTLFHSVDAV